MTSITLVFTGGRNAEPRCDARSSFIRGSRAFPPGPPVKIYTASAKADSGTILVYFFSRVSIQRQGSEERDLVSGKSDRFAYRVKNSKIYETLNLGQFK